MPIEYPKGPQPAGNEIKPGAGINVAPLELETYLDFTSNMGTVSEKIFGLLFQFPKWGFERFKIEESIEVSPVFREYYELTISQKRALQEQIRAGLATIFTAISDTELIAHDVRKYREFLDYFEKIEKGKWMIKHGKKEEGQRLVKEGTQTLKSIFIDQVDAHTGEGIALVRIVARWPTIIVDFQRLEDEDIDPRRIREKYKISEAEGVVLSTKNKLYVEWRDNLFFPTVKERYKRLFSALEARKQSIEEYTNTLKPVIARHLSMSETFATSKTRKALVRGAFWRPDSQALSSDYVKVWAWKPFAPNEKYKSSRESVDKVHAQHAGFSREEISKLKKPEPFGLGKEWDMTMDALPIEPSVDKVVRANIKKIEHAWGIQVTPKDIYDARKILTEKFKESTGKGLGGVEQWAFSPYFIFFELPIVRSVIRLPNGSQVENMFVDNFSAHLQTQNVIILHCLEIVAREKQMDQYIQQLLGELGVKNEQVMAIDDIIKSEYPEIFGTEPPKGVKGRIKMPGAFSKTGSAFSKIRTSVGKFLSTLGWEISFLRSEGPYEFAFYDRITKYYASEVGENFAMVKNFIKSQFQVP